MKKLTLLLLLFAPLTLNAKPMTAKDAESVVSNWFALDSQPLKSAMSNSIAGTKSYYNGSKEAIFHIVSLHPTGYVIVSADDLIEPIIGFIPKGDYNPDNPNSIAGLVTKDLTSRTALIKESSLKTQNSPGSMRVNADKWNMLLNKNIDKNKTASNRDKRIVSDVRISPLSKTLWSQKNVDEQPYFNYFTPNNYPSGCVITAQSQLMKYHEHPKTDVGTQSYAIYVDGNTQYGTLKGGDDNGGPYQWQNMDNTPLLSGFEETSAKAIGRLMHDVGLTLGASYSEGGTGAYSVKVIDSLKDVYDYSNVMGFTSYSAPFGGQKALMHKMFNTNLDAGYPTLFAIRDNGGGHMIMIDGYGYQVETMYHHLNMGWGGWEDGWYNLPNVDSSPGPYWKMTSAIYNVFPRGAGEVISGRILSKDKQPIVGANVKATDTQRGVTYEVISDRNGIYAFAKIPSQTTYKITATANGHHFGQKNVTTGRSIVHSKTVGNLWGVDLQSSNLAPAYSLNELLDNQTLGFSQSGDKDWLPSNESYFDSDAAESGYISNYQQSNIETEITGPAVLSFHWKVSSEKNWDKLHVKIDGNVIKSISGETDWQQEYIFVDSGTHKITWSYEKDNSNAAGQDKAWLDRVQLLPAISANEALDNNALTFTVDTPVTPWIGLQSSQFPADNDGLVSSVKHQYGASAIHTRITGPATLTFDWKVSSEKDWDILYVEVDGVKEATISGEVDWTSQSITIPAGEHAVGWVYYKDNDGSGGQDRAWIDNVQVLY